MTVDKMEFLVISSPYFHESVCDTSLKVGDAVISSSAQCRNLGVIFDFKLDMKQHVAMVCRSALFQLRKIGTIRKYLSDDSCATLVHLFVTSRIDYCNSLLANLPNWVLSKLQKVQNVAARILTRQSWCSWYISSDYRHPLASYSTTNLLQNQSSDFQMSPWVRTSLLEKSSLYLSAWTKPQISY